MRFYRLKDDRSRSAQPFLDKRYSNLCITDSSGEGLMGWVELSSGRIDTHPAFGTPCPEVTVASTGRSAYLMPLSRIRSP